MTVTILFALLCAVLPTRWTVVAEHEISRPDEPATLSGVSWVSNDTYLAATDWQPTLYELTIPVDPVSGRPGGCTVVPRSKITGCEDVEDVASDPLDRTKFFAVDERGGTISRHSVTGGTALATLQPTGALSRTRHNMGLESLTLSRDGRTLWTANEEAAQDDGPISCRKRGTDVRLARFRRADESGGWQADGEWVYRTDPIAGGSWKVRSYDAARSGVSALCLLEDGTLLALEREFSVIFLPRFRCRIYEVDFAGATDASAHASITNASITRVGKRLLHETKGLSMYEGLCAGPRRADGSTTLILVSDADHPFMAKAVMTIKIRPNQSPPSEAGESRK